MLNLRQCNSAFDSYWTPLRKDPSYTFENVERERQWQAVQRVWDGERPAKNKIGRPLSAVAQIACILNFNTINGARTVRSAGLHRMQSPWAFWAAYSNAMRQIRHAKPPIYNYKNVCRIQ